MMSWKKLYEHIYIYIIIYMNHHCHVIVIYIEATFSLAQIQFLSAVLVHPQTIWLKIPKHVSLKTEFHRNEHIMSPCRRLLFPQQGLHGQVFAEAPRVASAAAAQHPPCQRSLVERHGLLVMSQRMGWNRGTLKGVVFCSRCCSIL